MPHELKGREIFATGSFNGFTFDESDLDDIIANFEALPNFKVPLKFGHDADHNDGQPAIGWVSRIFKQGNKLLADFVDIPTVVYEAIKARLYRTISVEVLLNAKIDGQRFDHVLDAVALLGADRPAVGTLSDLNALLAKRSGSTGGHRVAFETIAGTKVKSKKSSFTIPKEDESEMDKDDVQKLVDAALKPLSEANVLLTGELKTANEKIAKFTTDKADGEKTVLEEKVKLARKAVTDVLDAAVRSKAMSPATRETYEKQIGLNDDERVLEIKVEDIKVMFKVKDPDDQTGLHGDNEDEGDNPEAELMALTRKCQAANPDTSFDVALKLTCAANPKLHVAYLNANGSDS